MALGDSLYRQFKGHQTICYRQCISILQVDFMLGRCHFMMGCLDSNSHILQCHHHISSGVFPKIHRTQVKIACLLMSDGRWLTIVIQMIQEKFTFRSHIKLISHICSFFDHFLQHKSRISLKWHTIRSINITDQSGHLSLLWSPWENGKRIQIRMQIHIRFFDPYKPFNRRSIKHTLIIQCFLQLTCRNGNIFQSSENIRKLQSDKFHVFFFYHANNIFSGILHK